MRRVAVCWGYCSFLAFAQDSGHGNGTSDWKLSGEASKNLGYMQFKKMHDAAMVLIERGMAKTRASTFLRHIARRAAGAKSGAVVPG